MGSCDRWAGEGRSDVLSAATRTAAAFAGTGSPSRIRLVGSALRLRLLAQAPARPELLHAVLAQVLHQLHAQPQHHGAVAGMAVPHRLHVHLPHALPAPGAPLVTAIRLALRPVARALALLRSAAPAALLLQLRRHPLLLPTAALALLPRFALALLASLQFRAAFLHQLAQLVEALLGLLQPLLQLGGGRAFPAHRPLAFLGGGKGGEQAEDEEQTFHGRHSVLEGRLQRAPLEPSHRRSRRRERAVPCRGPSRRCQRRPTTSRYAASTPSAVRDHVKVRARVIAASRRAANAGT